MSEQTEVSFDAALMMALRADCLCRKNVSCLLFFQR